MHEDLIPKWEQRIVGPFVRATMFRRRRARDWPVPDHLVHEAFRFAGNNGASLPGRWFPAPQGPEAATGTVVLCHPDKRYAQHWWIKAGWVDDLLAAGFNVLTFDFTQYGGSRGGSTYLYQEVILATEQARQRAPSTPLHVFGVSLGAYAAAVASPWLNVDSLILESPYPDFGSWYADADGQMGRAGRAAMASFGRIFPSTDAMIRADARMPDAQAKRILVAASKTDQITAESLSRRVAEAAPRARTKYVVLPNATHLQFRDEPAFRDAVWQALGRVPAAPAA